MSAVMSSKYQHHDVSSHAGVRMKFWGVCCVGGKAYKQVVNYRFHLTMAVLDPKSYDRDVRDRTVTLSVIQHGQVFLLCVLKHGEIQQVNLNLIFDKGDDVTFSVGGYGTVNLTGYQLIDSLSSNFDMDNKHYCPVAELGSENRLGVTVNDIEAKNFSQLRKALMKKGGGDEDEEEEDSDFSISCLVDKEESSSEEESVESEDGEMLVSEIRALKEELENDERFVSEVRTLADKLATPMKSERSQKRKHENMSLSEKRIKKDTDETSHKDDESDSDEGGMNSSIGNTPMPKKKNEFIKAKKKLKKKKRLSEISNIDKAEKENNDASPIQKDMNEVKKTKKSEKKKFSLVRLECGVEYQDVSIGKGPIATNGKIVSVFYLGKLENNAIFDSRTVPKKPYSFKLGVPEVIKGLDIGINGMRVGGRRKLKIPPKMGYGSKGIENVPPNSTLYFTVELVSVN